MSVPGMALKLEDFEEHQVFHHVFLVQFGELTVRVMEFGLDWGYLISDYSGNHLAGAHDEEWDLKTAIEAAGNHLEEIRLKRGES